MGVIKRPLREYPADIRKMDSLLRSLELEVATDEIQDNAVGNSEIRDSGPCSVIGRAVNSNGDPADIAAPVNNRIFMRRSNVLVFALLLDADIPVTIARAADVTSEIAAHTASADNTTAAELTAAIAAALPQVADDFADDAAAAIGGISVGELYHTAGVVKVRRT